MFFFFQARAEKGIAWHIEESIVVWTVIDNGKQSDLGGESWVRFPPRSKDFFATSCGSLIPFTRANAQWVIHGFN